jgi:hypothetical protein
VGAAAFVIAEIAMFLLYDLLPVLPDHNTEASIGPLTHPNISLLIASVIAVEIAIVFKFYAHEHWTFPDRRRPESAVVRFLKFNASCILSPITVATVNVLTFIRHQSYVAVSIGTMFGFSSIGTSAPISSGAITTNPSPLPTDGGRPGSGIRSGSVPARGTHPESGDQHRALLADLCYLLVPRTPGDPLLTPGEPGQ